MASCIATRGLHAVFTSRPAYARALSTVTHARITRDSTLRTPIDCRRAWALGSSAGQLGVGVSTSDASFVGLSRGLHTGSYAWCAHSFPVEPLDDFDWETLLSMQQTACEKYSDNPLFGTKTVGTAACIPRTRGRSQIGPLSRQGPGQFEWMTYRDFGQRVDDFRGALSHAGLRAGDKACGGSCWSRCHVSYCSYTVPCLRPQIAIISKNRVEWAVAAFAGYDCAPARVYASSCGMTLNGAWRRYGLGVHAVPMYEQQLVEDWQFIVQDSGAKMLLVSTGP